MSVLPYYIVVVIYAITMCSCGIDDTHLGAYIVGGLCMVLSYIIGRNVK